MVIIVFFVVFFVDCKMPQKAKKSIKTYAKVKKFIAWKQKFNKTYKTPEEEDSAMDEALANFDVIEAHNNKCLGGESTYTAGPWKYADLSEEEKRKYLLGVIFPPNETSMANTKRIGSVENSWIPLVVPPDALDWSEYGLVGVVMDQGL